MRFICLEFEGITDTRQHREDANLVQTTRVHICLYPYGIHVAIDIVTTNIEDMFRLLPFLVREMEIDSQVKTMVVRHLVTIAFLVVLYLFVIVFIVELCSQCAAIACSINERAGYVDARRYLILQGDTQIMFSVVFGVKRFTVVDIVELTHRTTPSITDPSGYRAYFAL